MRKHALSTLAALALAVTAVNAHAFDFKLPKVPSFGGKAAPAKSAPASTGKTTASAAPANSAASASKFAKMSDEEIATLAIKEILGEANQVTATKPPASGTIPNAEGTFAYSTSTDGSVFEKRKRAILEKDYGATGDDFFKVSKNRYCVEKVKKFEGVSGKQVDEMCSDYSHYAERPFEMEVAIRGATQLPSLVKAISDEKQRKEYLTKFANTFGYDREQYQWPVADHSSDKFRGVQLKEKALDKWSFRTVRYAARWAKENNLDADVVAKLEKAIAKAPKIRCAKEPGWLYREYEGGSTYGDIKFNQNYVFPEIVDCAEAKMKSDATHLAALPKIEPLQDRTKWLSVKPEESWRVYNNDYGQIGGKHMDVTVYFEQEY